MNKLHSLDELRPEMVLTGHRRRCWEGQPVYKSGHLCENVRSRAREIELLRKAIAEVEARLPQVTIEVVVFGEVKVISESEIQYYQAANFTVYRVVKEGDTVNRIEL